MTSTRVGQGAPVVGPAAGAHGRLLEGPQAGRRLAGVADARRRPAASARSGGSRVATPDRWQQEVERGALGGEDRRAAGRSTAPSAGPGVDARRRRRASHATSTVGSSWREGLVGARGARPARRRRRRHDVGRGASRRRGSARRVRSPRRQRSSARARATASRTACDRRVEVARRHDRASAGERHEGERRTVAKSTRRPSELLVRLAGSRCGCACPDSPRGRGRGARERRCHREAGCAARRPARRRVDVRRRRVAQRARGTRRSRAHAGAGASSPAAAPRAWSAARSRRHGTGATAAARRRRSSTRRAWRRSAPGRPLPATDGLDDARARTPSLEQRVRRQPVGAVHAGAGHLAARPQAGQGRTRRRGR